MDDPDTWRWVWFIAVAVFAAGELLTAGFFLLPFAVGALAALVLSFLDAGIGAQWAGFLGVSIVSFFSLRPIARRLDAAQSSEGIGSRRLIGEKATVLVAIPAGSGETGMIRVDREEWRAEAQSGVAIPDGTPVRIVEIRGTRAIVEPATAPTTDPDASSERSPS